MWMPPLELGSGKLGTPWARMHFENCRNVEGLAFAEVPVPPDAADPPHAATPPARHNTVMRAGAVRIG
jgi:hypothetical protein